MKIDKDVYNINRNMDLTSITCQARPEYPVTLPGGAWAWGRVGDQPKPVTATAAPGAAAAATTTTAAAAAPRATTAAAEAEFETIFAVSGDSASAEPLLASSAAVIELTTASPPVTLEDGRWSWGVVDIVEQSKRSAVV